MQRLQPEVDRLHSELERERSSKEQHAHRVAALEKQLQDKSAQLVSVRHVCLSTKVSKCCNRSMLWIGPQHVHAVKDGMACMQAPGSSCILCNVLALY